MVEQARGTRARTVTLALPERQLCGNGALPASRGAKMRRERLVKRQRAAVRLACGSGGEQWPGPVFAEGRVRIDVLVRRDPLWSARRLDDDNLWRGLKPTLDGLADAGIVANDRQFSMGRIVWEKAEPLRGAVVLTLTAEEAA